MKKIILLLTLVTGIGLQAQERILQPQISVSGEGVIKVIPNEATISIASETKGKDSAKTKKENDLIIDKVLKFLKTTKISPKDIQTEQVSLYKQRDYDTKEDYYKAYQSITIKLKDLSQYEKIMEELINLKINRINGVSFHSSEIEKYKSEARILAVKDAQKKASDYAEVLNMKAKTPLYITDNSQPVYYPVARNMMLSSPKMDYEAENRETLAIGEIEIRANINVIFSLE